MNNKQKAAGGGVVALIIAGIVAVEGGWVNDKNDPGGETNHGITKRVAVDNGYTGPMRDLTQAQAIDIYATQYVRRPGFEPLAELSPAVLEELADTGVNVGTFRAARWFQTSLNMLNRNGQDCPNVVVDGAVGPRTIQAFQCLQRVRGVKKTCQLVIKLLDGQQTAHYMGLANSDPKFKTFMVGWVDHRVGNVGLVKC